MFVCLDARISYGHKTFSGNNSLFEITTPTRNFSHKKLQKTHNPVFVRSLLFLNTIVCEKVKVQAVDFSSVSDWCFLVGPVLVVCWPARWTDKPLQNSELIRNTALLVVYFINWVDTEVLRYVLKYTQPPLENERKIAFETKCFIVKRN